MVRWFTRERIAGSVLTVIGLASLPDDLVTWQDWLENLLGFLNHGATRWAFVVVGLALFTSDRWAPRLPRPTLRVEILNGAIINNPAWKAPLGEGFVFAEGVPVVGVSGEFINRHRVPVSAAFDLHVDDWEILGTTYDNWRRLGVSLLDALPNPMFLGERRAELNNRIGHVAFLLASDQLGLRGLTLDDVVRKGELVVSDRWSRRTSTIRLADV